MQSNSVKILMIITVLFVISSCGSKKDLYYFQDSDGSVENMESYFVPILEIGDILSIEITGPDQELAKPFNQSEMVRQGNAQSTSYVNGIPATYGYLISEDSTVSLPIIGKVTIAGLNRTEAVNKIESKVGEYLNDPSVSIRILNFKVTVLGDVKNPGTFAIPNERVTILEAIGIANDLNITGQRRNILVIRHEDGVKKEYLIDLTSKEVFQSEAYYLKQNDVIYVQPNRKARYESSMLKSTGGIIISATSLIISTMVLIFNK